MRKAFPFFPLVLFGAATACGSVPDDSGSNVYAPGGVIQGTVIYQGPRPCSSGGHIVGNAVMLVFDRQNPPPPNGLGATVVNFADVTGDVLFANEPRYTGSEVYCPYQAGFTETITVSAPWVVAPVAAGSYIIQAFFDYQGAFLPTFKFAQLPEEGDVGGGYIDTADAQKEVNAGNPNYQAHFLEVDVGTAQPLPAGSPANAVPAYTLPADGYVASNVTVSLGEVLPLTRPYLYPQGLTTAVSSDGTTLADTVVQSSDIPQPSPMGIPDTTGIANTVETDPNYAPVLTIPQDFQALSAPGLTPGAANVFEHNLPHIKLVFGVASSELPTATSAPFNFQLNPSPTSMNPQGAFSVWQNAAFDPTPTAASPEGQWIPLDIPEGNGLPQLWPVVILSKLIDDPGHTLDPASLTAQGSATAPAVILQGITLLEKPQMALIGNPSSDTILNTIYGGPPPGDNALFNYPAASASDPPVGPHNSGYPNIMQQDEITVALRPSVICFSQLFDGNPDNRGVIVTPYQFGEVAAFPTPTGQGPIVPVDLLDNDDPTRAQVTNLVSAVQYGCLPTGRYAINVVYPDGQAWTVPNEAGACTTNEGTTEYNATPPTCSLTPTTRPLIHSQGTRAVVEITATTNPANCVATPPAAGTNLMATVLPFGSPPPAVPSICLPTPGYTQ